MFEISYDEGRTLHDPVEGYKQVVLVTIKGSEDNGDILMLTADDKDEWKIGPEDLQHLIGRPLEIEDFMAAKQFFKDRLKIPKIYHRALMLEEDKYETN